MLSIYLRPPEIEDRQFPGHWEGELIKGKGNASAANVLQAFSDKLLSIAAPVRLSMTCDRSWEIAMYKNLTEKTGVAVYFCYPHSPWQRGSN